MVEYQDMDFDEEYRKILMEQAETEEGLNQLYNEALTIDKQAMEKISPNDTKRIVRVLEIYHSTGKTKTELEIESRKNGVKYNYHVFVVNMDREKLYERINLRVDMMINAGLIEEVKDICKRYNSFPTAMQGLGYKEVVEYLENKTSKEEMIDKIKKESRHYAKRQLTWFRKDKDFIWLDGFADVNHNVGIIREEVKI